MGKRRRHTPVRTEAVSLPTPDAAPADRAPWRFRSALALVVFALVFVLESVNSYRQKSATWDEPIHLADGYFSLARHDYRYDPAHPPLMRMLAALPLLGDARVAADQQAIEDTRPDTWAINAAFEDAHRFLYQQNDADRLLYRARFMVVLCGVLLGVLVFLWTNAWLGLVPATAALAMVALEPNLVAHSSLVTTDAGLVCFSFGAVYFLWRTVERPGVLNAAGVCLFFALAVTTKFSAALLYPIAFALLAVAAVGLRRLTAGQSALIALAIVITSWAAIWTVYRFQYAPSDSATWLYHFQGDPGVIRRVPTIAAFIAWVDQHRLLPNVFSQGFLLGQAQAQVRTAYLAGRISETGWWYFFPFAIAIKTPLALLALSLAGAAGLTAAWLKNATHRSMFWFALLPIAGFLVPAMLSNLNIGLRHVLPIYPFLVLLAAFAVKQLLDRRDSLGRAAIGIAAVCWLFEYGRSYPDTLAFFNTLVGGPAHGSDYLVDSNLDWGQDLKPLKAWMDANRIPDINLAYFGSADPAYYGIRCTYLNGSPIFIPQDALRPPRLPGYVAVSATVMSGTNFEDPNRDFYKPLRALTPVASIGHTIDVYWVDKPWWPPAPFRSED